MIYCTYSCLTINSYTMYTAMQCKLYSIYYTIFTTIQCMKFLSIKHFMYRSLTVYDHKTTTTRNKCSLMMF